MSLHQEKTKSMKNKLKYELLNSEKPSEFFEYIKRSNKLSDFPELEALVFTPQDSIWHPEGSVWRHTLMVVDVAAGLRNELDDEKQALAYMLGALAHDFGKPFCTVYSAGHIKSPMHDSLGLAPAFSFLRRISAMEFAYQVKSYVLEHLKPMQLYKNAENLRDSSILRLNSRIFIPDLIRLAKADHWGRDDDEARNRIYPPGDWLFNKFITIIQTKIKPKAILRGRYFQKHDIPPCSAIGTIIKESLELQILGKITNEREAHAFADSKLKEIGLI